MSETVCFGHFFCVGRQTGEHFSSRIVVVKAVFCSCNYRREVEELKRFEAVFDSLEVIEERIREKLTVENLACSVHFSKYHYQRLFREAVGESVMRYVARRRMALAAQELAGTDASVLEIALKYGYDSHEGFTRGFRAHMGVTPAEYRKYHFSIGFPQTQKERGAIMYARNTDEIIKELNQLIVQARETVDFTTKNRDIPDAVAYAEFWDYTADRTRAAADALTETLERITAIARRPDEISARFMILKAIEDADFQFQLTAFQTRLTVSRAKPEHRKAFEPICGQYAGLARNAGMRAGRIAGFLGELAELIFRDMRENALKCLQEAVESGRAAADALADPALPYGYIADAVRDIADELSSLPLREVTVVHLEDCGIRLDIIASAAAKDGWRAPEHKALFNGIVDFRNRIDEAIAFFQNLPEDVSRIVAEAENGGMERSAAKKYSDMAFQGNILLFYLKGETQKLERYLNSRQRTALEGICDRLAGVIGRVAHRAEEETADMIIESLQGIYRDMTALAEELGQYGTSIQFIAEQIDNIRSA